MPFSFPPIPRSCATLHTIAHLRNSTSHSSVLTLVPLLLRPLYHSCTCCQGRPTSFAPCCSSTTRTVSTRTPASAASLICQSIRTHLRHRLRSLCRRVREKGCKASGLRPRRHLRASSGTSDAVIASKQKKKTNKKPYLTLCLSIRTTNTNPKLDLWCLILHPLGMDWSW